MGLRCTVKIWIDRPFGDVDAEGHDTIGPGEDELRFADAVIVGATTWDGSMMDRAPNVRVIARTGIGVDAVDLAAATERGIAVTNTPEGPTVSTAEHTIALMFASGKELVRQQERLRKATGDYARLNTAIEFDGLTLGLLAYGRIARRVARIASAVGMVVIAHDPFVEQSDLIDDPAGTELVTFEELCARSDVVSLHAPLAADTAKIFDAVAFAACKFGVIFINASRGGLVDHDALLAALHTGQVSNAGLDVTDPEPLPPDHPLLSRDDVIVTPHTASSTTVGRRRMLDMAIEQVVQVFAGEQPTNLVNTELLNPTWDDIEA